MRYTTRIIVPPRVRRSGMPGSSGGGPRPQAIGVRKSLGFGDRLGAAAAGHLAVAAEHPEFAPFFAQQSLRETTETGRTPSDALAVISRAVGSARYRQPWGADADRLRTPQDVDEAAAAGFTYYTVDLSGHVRADADELSPAELESAADAMVAGGELTEDWCAPYLDRAVQLPGAEGLRLDRDALRRAAVKFARTIQHGARMYETVSRANRGRPYEVEISLDGAASFVTAAEHLFLGLELEARGVRLTSLALRLDDRDLAAFEAALREHAAVASFCGPYKLSFRSGTHRPATVPAIGRCCGDTLHYKTSLETDLEALRLVFRLEPLLFQKIGADLPDPVSDETFFDEPAGAHRLDEIWPKLSPTGEQWEGRPLKTAVLELLEQRADIYQELLVARFSLLSRDLNAG